MYCPIKTARELANLNSDEIVRGYQSAWNGYVITGNESVSFTHGWHNGMADITGEPNDSQRALASDCARVKKEGKW